MRFILKPSILKLTKKFLVCLVLLSFSLFTVVSPLSAQTQNTATQFNQKRTAEKQILNSEPTTAGSQVLTATASGTVENGQVLGVCDAIGGIPIIGGVCDFFAKLLKFLFELVLRVIFYFIRIFGSVFGQSSEAACADDPNCVQAMRQVDPLYDASKYIAKVNVFTIADSSFNTLYTTIPEMNSVTYLADDFNHNVLGVKVAKAQSLGENTFGSVFKDIWQKFQNLAYIAMVLVLVTIGFMVMLRRRLDPRTVVSATNALPRVVIALLLITFSFAISGLFVDFIHISISLVRSYLNGIGGFSGILSKFGGAGGELIWLPFFTLLSKSILQIGAIITLIGAGGLAFFFLPGGQLILILTLIAAFGLDLLIRIFMFVLAAMLFWALAMRFVTLIILTIFSPVFFLFGAIPGYEGVVSTWFRRMASVALCFPIMLVFIYLAMALVGWGSVGNPFNNTNTVSAPPPIGETGFIINIGVLVGVGILFFAQKVPAFVDEMLGIKPSGGGSGRGGGGVGLGAAIAMPMAAGNAFNTLNRSAGAFANLTGAAVAKRGAIGAIATPFHNTLKFLAGGNEFDSTGQPNRNFIRSAQQIRDGTYNIRNAAGNVSSRGYQEASQVAKEYVKESFVKDYIASNPGKTRDDAEGAYLRANMAEIKTSHPNNPVNMAPGRTAVDFDHTVNELMNAKINELKTATPNISQSELNTALKEFAKRGYR